MRRSDEGTSVLLVASGGGHLSELAALVRRGGIADRERIWLTWRSPQSESMLAGEHVVWVAPVGPRDTRGVLALAGRAQRLLSGHGIDRVVTTGAALALAVVPIAASRGIRCHFIETATRPLGPSMTGRLLRAVPGMRLYTQYARLARPPWRYGGSVFDTYQPREGVARPSRARRIVVTLGTMERYPFSRLVRRVQALLPSGAEVLWQTGCTPARGLPGARPLVSEGALREAMGAADLVIGHCGCGTALSALDAGHAPILVPREQAFGEHVDNHQELLGLELARRGLAQVVPVAALDASHLAAASARRVAPVPAPPFLLDGPAPTARLAGDRSGNTAPVVDLTDRRPPVEPRAPGRLRAHGRR